MDHQTRVLNEVKSARSEIRKDSMFQNILNTIPELTTEQRNKLRYELKKYDRIGGNQVGSGEPDWLLEGFKEEMIRRGLWLRDIVLDVPKPYVESASTVKEELLKRVGKDLSYTEKLALGKLIAQCLIYYSGTNAPISLKFLCNSIQHVLPAVEHSFPGYMRANLLHVIIKRKQANE